MPPRCARGIASFWCAACFVLQRYKMTLFIHNFDKRLELLDLLTSISMMSITSRIFLEKFVLRRGLPECHFSAT